MVIFDLRQRVLSFVFGLISPSTLAMFVHSCVTTTARGFLSSAALITHAYQVDVNAVAISEKQHSLHRRRAEHSHWLTCFNKIKRVSASTLAV